MMLAPVRARVCGVGDIVDQNGSFRFPFILQTEFPNHSLFAVEHVLKTRNQHMQISGLMFGRDPITLV